ITAAKTRTVATVSTELGGGTVVGSAGRMSQVFVNLLVNATQALSACGDGREKTITISTHIDGERVVARVSDNGPGIRPEHLARLFEPFFTTKPAGTGTGLGLSICRETIQRHGGEIRVE